MRENIALREQSQEIEDARKALEDPAIQRAFKNLDVGIVDLIASIQCNSGEAWRDYEAECCRSLRTLRSLKRSLHLTDQRDRIEKENLGWLEQRKQEMTRTFKKEI